MINYISNILYQIYTEPIFLTHVGVFWSACFMCFLADIKAFINQRETQTKYVRPPDYYTSGTKKTTQGINWKLYLHATGRAIYVQFFLIAPMIWIFLPSYSLRYSYLPFMSTLLTFIYCILVEEILFYYGHRLLHLPSMWKYHSLHHQLFTPVAVASLYASTVENILVNILPVLLAPLIAGLPRNLLYIWMIIATISPIISHCGFKALEPLSKFHAIHHLTKNSNYSAIGLLDRIHGTYTDEIVGNCDPVESVGG